MLIYEKVEKEGGIINNETRRLSYKKDKITNVSS